MTNRYHFEKVTSHIVYTVEGKCKNWIYEQKVHRNVFVLDCVGKKCACRKFTPHIKKFEAVEISPGRLNISWEINQLNVNPRVYNITDKLFE